jgi:hypothetical protein
MTLEQYDSEAIREYRRKGARVAELRKEFGEKLGQAEIDQVQLEFDQLTVLSKELEDLRARLEPKNLFMARYNVTVLERNTVSFVLPKGVSRYKVLQEAEGVVSLTLPKQFKNCSQWGEDPDFTTPLERSEKFCIAGHVEGAEGKTRAQQEEYLAERGLRMANLEDVVVAFAVFYLATGEPHLSRYAFDGQYWVRTAKRQGRHFEHLYCIMGGTVASYETNGSYCESDITAPARL